MDDQLLATHRLFMLPRMSTVAEAGNPMKSHHNNHFQPSHHAPPARLQCQATPAQAEASACKPRLYPFGPHPLHPDLYRLHPLQASDARISTAPPGAKVWPGCSTPTATRHSNEASQRARTVLSWLQSPDLQGSIACLYLTSSTQSLPMIATFSHLVSPCQDRSEVIGSLPNSYFRMYIGSFEDSPVSDFPSSRVGERAATALSRHTICILGRH